MSIRVRTDSVSKHFGGVIAVDEVSLSVEPGSITGLIGPNGAGKSTLFNIITRVVQPTAGRVMVGETDVTHHSMTSCAALGVARTFQTPRGFASLSVLDNVLVMGRDPRESLLGALFKPKRPSQMAHAARAALERVGLAGAAGEMLGSISGGEQRMLEIARQLVREPKVLLLDEPTAGLDEARQDALRRLLLDLRADGMSILLIEHNLRFLFSTATYVHVMALGRLIASGTPNEVSSDETVIDAYLGRRPGHVSSGA